MREFMIVFARRASSVLASSSDAGECAKEFVGGGKFVLCVNQHPARPLAASKKELWLLNQHTLHFIIFFSVSKKNRPKSG